MNGLRFAVALAALPLCGCMMAASAVAPGLVGNAQIPDVKEVTAQALNTTPDQIRDIDFRRHNNIAGSQVRWVATTNDDERFDCRTSFNGVVCQEREPNADH